MDTKTKRIEIVTHEGQVVLSFLVVETDIVLEHNMPAEQRPDTGNSSKQGNSQPDESKMTDAQKRYLFRILADRGYEADRAHQHLLEVFQVDNLREVSKLEASRMIEDLLEDSKTNGGKNDRSSIQ